MTIKRQKLGKSGEDLAVEELQRRGYAILARRYRTRHGEIDVVARDGETTVFVEVKARTTGRFGGAAEAVTPWKQRRLVSMATDYLARRRLTDRACRFDVITVDDAEAGAAGGGSRSAGAVVTIYRNAFGA
jgi:putative endonuclease